ARIVRTSCLLTIVASLLIASSTTARAVPTLPGIDVSRWQGTIDWSKVAGAGIRFAIARATKGQHYVDPTFHANVARAPGNGYRLWLAHWNVPSPTVPANDWQGRGWTFWQWTHKPGLPGVTTDLDRDRFAGTNLVTAQIARLTATPGAGGSVTDITGRLSCG